MNGIYQSYILIPPFFYLWIQVCYHTNHQRILELVAERPIDNELQVGTPLSRFLLYMKRLGRHRSNAAGPSRSQWIRTRRTQPARLIHRHNTS